MLNARLNKLRETLIPFLQAAASQTGPHTWQAENEEVPSTQAAAETGAERLQAALLLSGALSGTLVFSIQRSASALLFGDEGNQSELWIALVLSVGERLCPALAAAFGAVTLQGCRLPDPSGPVHPLLPTVVLRSTDEHTMAEIDLAADDTLHAQLRSPAQTAEASATPPPTPLHRVIDVPLAVTLRFGQRHLTLREVLELKTGSLLELDRQVEEAVDLMLGERVIARGEVVIIDGNYGMRITEVLEIPGGGASARINPPPLRYGTA